MSVLEPRVFAPYGLGQGGGCFRLEVTEVESAERPTVALLRELWKKRRAGRSTPALAFWHQGDDALLCGPDGENPTVVHLPSTSVLTILRTALATPCGDVVPAVLAIFERAQGSGGVAGFRNRSLISTYCATKSFKRDAACWQTLTNGGMVARKHTGAALLRALGFTAAESPSTFQVVRNGAVAAFGMVVKASTSLDRSDAGIGGTPTTLLIGEARLRRAPRAVVVSGRIVRTYLPANDPTRDDLATAATFTELDLDLLNDS